MKVFRAFRLDTPNQSLWHDHERVSITPKAFEVLRYFVEHPGRLVTQDELLEAVWPETYVNSELVKKYIKEIRKALGDSPTDAAFIRTYPKRGYEFVAPVFEEAQSIRAHSDDQTVRIVGRETALLSLHTAFQKALRGGRQVVFVTGEAGIGKTTLVDRFIHEALRTPALRVARGQCVEGFGGKEPYYPILEALGQLLRMNSSSAVVDLVLKQAPTWMIQFPSLIKSEQKEMLHRDILGSTRDRMLREICEALEALSADQPLCMVLEDLHWGDNSTVDFISAVARRRGPASLLVVGTYRPVDVLLAQSPLKTTKQDLLVHQLCSEIALEQLEQSQIADYLVSEYRIENAAELAQLVYRHSGGNALFMIAILHELTKQAIITQDNGHWKLNTSVADIEVKVPETLQHLLDLQFEQLSTVEQQTLKAASVVGERFSALAVAPLLDVQAESVDDVCAVLAARTQFIRAAGISELQEQPITSAYEFKHALYRQSVYRKLSEMNRSNLHRKLGENLSVLYTLERPEFAAELALHFEQGGDYESTVRYLLLTAENAARRFAYRDCIEILQHAREFLPKLDAKTSTEQEILLSKLLGDAHYALGEVVEAAWAYESEVALAARAGNTKAQISALSRLAYVSAITDATRGIAASERAVEVSRNVEGPELLGRTQALAAGFRIVLDRWRSEDADICTAADEYPSETDGPVVNETLYSSHARLLRGHYSETLRALEDSKLDLGSDNSVMQYLRSWVEMLALLHMGQLGRLLTAVRSAIALAQRNGNNLWCYAFSGIEAWLRALTLDFEGAKRLCEPVLSRGRDPATRTPNVLGLLFLGHAENGLGNSRDALRHFSAVEEITADRFYLHWYWRMQAQLGVCDAWLHLGNFDNATRKADVFAATACGTDDPNLRALAWEMKAKIASAAGDWIAAQAFIIRALEALQTVEIPLLAWHVHAEAAQISHELKSEAERERHRQAAKAAIQKIADSFPAGESLRTNFLAAPSVIRMLCNESVVHPPVASAKANC